MEKVQKIPSSKESEKKLSNHIHFALDIEQNFKLYSYRIISPEVFQARNTELIDFLKSQK